MLKTGGGGGIITERLGLLSVEKSLEAEVTDEEQYIMMSLDLNEGTA